MTKGKIILKKTKKVLTSQLIDCSYQLMNFINILILVSVCFFNNSVYSKNKQKDQISINISNSTTNHPLKVLGKFAKLYFEEMYMFSFQYSQNDKIFRLNGRRNFEIISWLTFQKNELSKYTQIFVGLSQDVIINITKNFYFGAGLGIYIKDKKTDRISSQFTFGQNYFIGYKFPKNFDLELIIKHFSNGGLTEINHGQNFLGFKVNYNF